MKEKLRLDTELVSRGLAQSRERAKAYIMSGVVYVNNQKALKPGDEIKPTDNIEVRGETLKYVSRGGLKLEKAMREFSIELSGKTCMDVGASTGGFTDCMLQNGAVKVYSVDVGYGQLDWKLRQDERVVNLERTNIRYVTREQIPDAIDFSSVDVSFISLTLVLPVVRELLSDNGRVMCLIKPQFEAGKGKVGKKGVVREPEIHYEVIDKILGFMAEHGFNVLALDYSPIRGPEGNIEYLAYAEKCDTPDRYPNEKIRETVINSHNELDGGKQVNLQ